MLKCNDCIELREENFYCNQSKDHEGSHHYEQIRDLETEREIILVTWARVPLQYVP